MNPKLTFQENKKMEPQEILKPHTQPSTGFFSQLNRYIMLDIFVTVIYNI